MVLTVGDVLAEAVGVRAAKMQMIRSVTRFYYLLALD
jgi:hypothetical protein